MFNGNFKLICSVVGLMAVLVMGLAMPGVTQQNPLSRANVVNAISNAVAATLTAAEGDIFDTDNAKFYSGTKMSFAYIPLHPASRSLQVLNENLDRLFAGENLNVNLGAFYIPDAIPGFFLKPGSYLLKLVNKDRVAFVDSQGLEVFYASKVEAKDTRGQPGPFSSWKLTVDDNPSLIIGGCIWVGCLICIFIIW